MLIIRRRALVTAVAVARGRVCMCAAAASACARRCACRHAFARCGGAVVAVALDAHVSVRAGPRAVTSIVLHVRDSIVALVWQVLDSLLAIRRWALRLRW